MKNVKKECKMLQSVHCFLRENYFLSFHIKIFLKHFLEQVIKEDIQI